MVNAEIIALFISVVVTFFVIIDPLGSLPIFMGLTRIESKEKKKSWLKQLFLIKSLKKKYGE